MKNFMDKLFRFFGIILFFFWSVITLCGLTVLPIAMFHQMCVTTGIKILEILRIALVSIIVGMTSAFIATIGWCITRI